MNIESLIVSISLAAVFVCIISLIRNQIVFRHQMRALEVAHRRAQKDLGQGNFLDWGKHYKKLESYGSYKQMVLDWTKWTYKQFYPDFE